MDEIWTFEEYRDLAARTSGAGNWLNWGDAGSARLAAAGLGLVGEVAEVTELIGRFMSNGEIDRDLWVKELGDCLWYIAEIDNALELRLPTPWPSSPAPLGFRSFPECCDWLAWKGRLFSVVAGKEIGEALKKYIFHGHNLDRGKLIQDLDGALRFVVLFCDWLDTPIGYVARVNIDKLDGRYNGGFSAERSRSRAV